MTEESKTGDSSPATVLDVRKLQCSQAVMALLRQMVHTQPGGLVEIWWQEADARRDMLAVVRRQGHRVVAEAEGPNGDYQILTVAKKTD